VFEWLDSRRVGPREMLSVGRHLDRADDDDDNDPTPRSLVEDPYYRDVNLAENNIYMRPPHEDFPKEVADLVDHVRKDRGSPGGHRQ